MSVDLTFTNNQNWVLVYNASQWAAIYDLTVARFRMQIRSAPNQPVIYSFDSGTIFGVKGVITYLAANNFIVATASYADVRAYMPSGSYVHDMTIEIDDPITGQPAVIRDIASGSCTIMDGVTLQ